MNCELIFYLAGKTGLCEKALEESITKPDLSMSASLFATTPETLGVLVIDAFERANVVFVVGGLYPDKNGIENVLSKALANKAPDDLKKLKNPCSDADGYLIRQGGQLLVVLPDEPDEIRAMLTETPLEKYLVDFTEV